jgi:hypothetical protein
MTIILIAKRQSRSKATAIRKATFWVSEYINPPKGLNI